MKRLHHRTILRQQCGGSVLTQTAEPAITVSDDLNLYAQWLLQGSTRCTISTGTSEHGTVTASPALAVTGKVVTIRLNPDAHYELVSCFQDTKVLHLQVLQKLNCHLPFSPSAIVSLSPFPFLISSLSLHVCLCCFRGVQSQRGGIESILPDGKPGL